MEMWKRSIEQDKERFKRSAEMFRQAQNKQMDQTNAILTVLKAFSKTCCQSRAENELTFFTFRDLYITFVQSKKNVIFTLNLIMLVPAVTRI